MGDVKGRTKLLFVDDEQQVLDGLRNVLRKERATWDMHFACGGEAGITALRAGAFDVVVSDLRMPRMDGATFLAHAKELQPHATRIVLSGQSDMETAMRTVFVAHQFLAKPCSADALRGAVLRATELGGLIESPEVRAMVGSVGMLPAAPGSFAALNKVLADNTSSLEDVAKVVQRDSAVSAKLLQLVNSAFFGLPRKVENITEAATFLGVLTIRNLALGVEALRMTAGADDGPALSRHVLLTAELAKRMFPGDRAGADRAFSAGLLHAVGLLLRGKGTGREFPPEQHGMVGAYLLNMWGLPHTIVGAVAFRDAPARVAGGGTQFDVGDAVHVADHLASHAEGAPPCSCPGTVLDWAHLGARGVTEKSVEGWRALAAELVKTVEL